MVIAARTTSTLGSGITQITVINALLTAFSNAGYSAPFDNYTSGSDRVLVYTFISDASKSFGTNYYKVRVNSSLQVFVQILTSWNTTSKQGANASTDTLVVTLSTTSTISFDALNGGIEYKLVVVTQSATSIILGVLCPANKPTWWDINTFPWGFIFVSSLMNTFAGSSLNPYSNASYSSFLNTALMGIANLQTNRRDVLTGIIILSNSNRGVAGKTSDDLAIASANGNSKFDVLTFPGSTSEYLIINNVSGGLAVRIA